MMFFARQGISVNYTLEKNAEDMALFFSKLAAISGGMEIMRKRITDIIRRKEEQDEHTVQEGSLGTLRAVSAH